MTKIIDFFKNLKFLRDHPSIKDFFIKISTLIIFFILMQFFSYFAIPSLIERTSDISSILKGLPGIMFSIPSLPSTLLLPYFKNEMAPLSVLKILELMIRSIGFILSATGAIAVYILKEIRTPRKRLVGVGIVLSIFGILLKTILDCLALISHINTDSQKMVQGSVIAISLDGLIWGIILFGILVIISPVFFHSQSIDQSRQQGKMAVS